VVLLIACANIANLMLARASARHREMAVRLAMGAARSRIIRQLLTESILVSLIGAAVGVLFARWATRLIVAMMATPRTPAVFDLHPDWRVLLFTCGAAVFTGILFGLLPAFRATRADLGVSLRERAQNLRGSEPRAGAARLLLALQVALSVVLISGAGLFAGSLVRIWNISPGFDPKNLLLIGLDTSQRPEKGPQLTQIYRRLLARVNALPGVRSASMVWLVPLSGAGWDDDVKILSGPDITADLRDTWANAIGPHYFDTMRIPLLAGRDFTESDDKGVGIINETAARTWFGHGSAIGQQVRFQNSVIRIIGVAADSKYLDLRDPDSRTLYLPASDNASMTMVIRADASLASLYPAVRSILREIAQGTPTTEVRSMSEEVDQSIGRERLMAVLSVFFGVLAMLLTSIGLYGILAYAVTRRTGEIGVRMALGAQRHNVIWLVLRETLGHVAAGIAVGIVAVLATARLVASLLYGVRPRDPATLLMAVFALAITAAVAAWLPARRATRLDPMTALRDE
jgi:predicted permease